MNPFTESGGPSLPEPVGTIRRRPILERAGLILGAGTVLVRAHSDHFGRPCLDLDRQETRLLTLLQAAHGRVFDSWVVEALRPAASAWRAGDADLADLRLRYAGLPDLPPGKLAPARLALAARWLDAGRNPESALRAAAGFRPALPARSRERKRARPA